MRDDVSYVVVIIMNVNGWWWRKLTSKLTFTCQAGFLPRICRSIGMIGLLIQSPVRREKIVDLLFLEKLHNSTVSVVVTDQTRFPRPSYRVDLC